ncbi:MAG: DUF2169 domain-containing protein [Gemmataceae bacterium]|nr:DUF2169 domain-containing protein [Gemmataceae bacterium]
MLTLINQTPYTARAVPLRDREGHPVAVFIVKGTYKLGPGGLCQLAEEQTPLVEGDEYYGEPGASSVRYESDLAVFKPATDAVLLGSARAPQGKPVRELDVSFAVGPVKRTVRVFGKRRWQAGVLKTSATDPEEFSVMPLTFENAFGGKNGNDWEPRNPVGRGIRSTSKKEEDAGKAASDWLLPHLEDPANPIRSWRDKPAPAATGFVCRSWAPRVPLAGTYDEAWINQRCPILPEDFDYRYFNAAPAGQVVEGYLRGGETVSVTNTTPEGKLTFALPKVRIGLETRCLGKTNQPELVLDTLVVDTDRMQCFLVWRCRIRYRHSLDDFGGAWLYDLDGPGIREEAEEENP